MPFLPLRRTTDPPHVLRTTTERFYAHVPWVEAPPEHAELELDDIAGMSGGPIFAVRNPDSNAAEYWLIAVQSSWLPGRRVLAGSFMETIAREINCWIDRHQDGLQDYLIRGT